MGRSHPHPIGVSEEWKEGMGKNQYLKTQWLSFSTSMRILFCHCDYFCSLCFLNSCFLRFFSLSCWVSSYCMLIFFKSVSLAINHWKNCLFPFSFSKVPLDVCLIPPFSKLCFQTFFSSLYNRALHWILTFVFKPILHVHCLLPAVFSCWLTY